MVKSIMMTVVEDWRKPDKGIWEIRGEGQHFVSSKVMCWVALDRGARIARILNKYENSRRWEEEADAIKADVMRNGWKERNIKVFTSIRQSGFGFFFTVNGLMDL